MGRPLLAARATGALGLNRRNDAAHRHSTADAQHQEHRSDGAVQSKSSFQSTLPIRIPPRMAASRLDSPRVDVLGVVNAFLGAPPTIVSIHCRLIAQPAWLLGKASFLSASAQISMSKRGRYLCWAVHVSMKKAAISLKAARMSPLPASNQRPTTSLADLDDGGDDSSCRRNSGTDLRA
jgi:hypothetical protein